MSHLLIRRRGQEPEQLPRDPRRAGPLREIVLLQQPGDQQVPGSFRRGARLVRDVAPHGRRAELAVAEGGLAGPALGLCSVSVFSIAEMRARY